MVGIGVGFDTLGAKTFTVKEPQWTNDTLLIEDSREGWVNSVHTLLDGYILGKKFPTLITPLFVEKVSQFVVLVEHLPALIHLLNYIKI